MRYWAGVIAAIAAVALLTENSWAQEPKTEVQSVEPPAESSERNIFESLQLEMLDLEKLREEIASKLVGEPRRITLDECVSLALTNNQDVLIIGFETAIADAELMGARGQFDPSLNLRQSYTDSIRPPNPQTRAFSGISQAIESTNQDYQLTVGGFSPIGTQYDVGLSVNREIGTFTTVFDDMGNPIGQEPVWSADLTLTITQPLLRGFGLKTNLVRVRSAKNQQLIAAEQVQLQLLNTIGAVIKAYWDLVGANQQLLVQQEALDNATRILRINEQRLELGTASALEVVAAKAQVAARQSDLISARTAVFTAEDILKNLIGLYDESGELLSMNSLVPQERPNVQDVEFDIEGSMRTALERRPDIKSAELAVENAELETQRTRNDLLPQFDVQGSYGRNTIRLNGNEIFEGIGEPDGRSWSIGGVFSIPIGNRTARGNHERAKLIVRQQDQRLIQTRQTVMLSVRQAVTSLASNRILVESAKQGRMLEEANVDAEERRLRIGVTTTQNVLDRQEDLTAAQAREVNAQVEFEKSRVDLQVAEGTLLESYGVVFEPQEYGEGIGFWRSLGPNPDGN